MVNREKLTELLRLYCPVDEPVMAPADSGCAAYTVNMLRGPATPKAKIDQPNTNVVVQKKIDNIRADVWTKCDGTS
jgi:hypothetical protein